MIRVTRSFEESVITTICKRKFHFCKVGTLTTCIEKEKVNRVESEGIRQILSFVRIRPCFVAITTLGRQVLIVRSWRRVVITLKVQGVRTVRTGL